MSTLLALATDVAAQTSPTTTPSSAPAAQSSRDSLPPVTATGALTDVSAVEVRGFRFEGNHAIATQELNDVAERVRSQQPSTAMTFEQLEQVRQAITAHYVDSGYINSGAILPDQTIRDGLVLFRIVEGRLSEVHARTIGSGKAPGKPRLRKRYVAERIDSSGTLNVNRLRDELELLRQDSNIGQVNATLRPGVVAGESILDVSATDAPLVGLEISFNNYHTPSAGAERFDAFLELRNPTGLGDSLAVNYGITEGGWDSMQWAGLDSIGLRYAVPITARGTTIAVDYQRSDDLVIEQPFADLDVTSISDSFSLTVRHPIARTPTRELALFASAAYRTSETSLLGDPFSFEPGVIDGKISLTVLRFGAERIVSTREDALTLRGSLNVGTDWFGSTNNGDDIVDSQFTYFLGQAAYVHRFGDSDTRLAARGAFQLTTDSLPSLEQFPIGGHDTVRGYRENRLVRDNGVYGSLEFHVPLPGPQREGHSIWEFVPFADAGYGTDMNSLGVEEDNFIASIGAGVIANPIKPVHVEVFYGYPFQDFPNSDDLQDVGVHFWISWRTDF